MRQDVIKTSKHVARETVFSVKASTDGDSISPAQIKAFEKKAFELIRTASDSDIEEAFDFCLECGLPESEVTFQQVLKVIGDRAEKPLDSLSILYIDYKDA